MKELACKDMTLVFSVITTNEDSIDIEADDVMHSVVTEADPYITTDDDKGFYFGDVTVRVTEITYEEIYRFTGLKNLILKPSAQYVSRIEDDSKALLNGDSSEPVAVRLMPPEGSPLSPIDISIIAKVETPGQNSVWGS